MRHNLLTRTTGLVAAGLLIAACTTQAITPTIPPPELKTVLVAAAPKVVVLTPTPQPTALQAVAKKALRLNFGPSDVTTIDPSLSADIASGQIVEETTVGLVRLDEMTQVPRPGMATAWDISADGREYTFHLRSNVPWVKWDDAKGEVVKVQDCQGRDRMVTARDFEYGFLRTLNPKTGGTSYLLNFVLEGAEDYSTGATSDTAKVGVKAVDDETLVLKFKEPAAYNASIAGAGRAEPRWLIEGDECTAARGERWTETGFFQGYGPFTLKDWVHDSTITLVKNPYWPESATVPAAKIEEITWSMLDDAAAFTDFEAGNIDIAVVPPAEMDRVKSDPALSKQLSIASLLCTETYGFNTTAPFVDDARVRRALSAAIDRRALIDDVLKGDQEPAQWFARPGVAGAPTLKDHPDLGIQFDVAKGRAELEAYLKDKNLTADQLDLTLMISSNPRLQKMAEAIQQMWKANLGVTVKLSSQEWKVYLKTIQDPQNTPQIYYAPWCDDYPDASNFDRDYAAHGGAMNPAGGGGFNWQNPDYEKLVAEAGRELDPARRIALYAQAEGILVNQDAVMIPLDWNTRVTTARPYVTRSFPADFGYMEKWDVDMAAKGR